MLLPIEWRREKDKGGNNRVMGSNHSNVCHEKNSNLRNDDGGFLVWY